MNKHLSFIIPMYNAASFITNCVSSIVNQGLDPNEYEIIIINDGSTDNSLSIVEGLQRKHCHIRIITQENQGQSVARNRGIKEAVGEYIWFVDADDFLIPNSLKAVYDTIFIPTPPETKQSWSEYRTCDIITFDRVQSSVKDFNNLTISHSEPQYAPILKGTEFIAQYPTRFPYGPWWYFIRKDFIQRNSLSFQEGKLLEDGLFIMTALVFAQKVGYVSRALYFYAIRPGSTMYTFTPAHLEKLNDSFRNAILYLSSLIEKGKVSMGKDCYRRLLMRRNGYIVFLLIRLLKYSNPEDTKNTIKWLKSQDLYPIKEFIGRDYNGLKLRLGKTLVNNENIYIGCCYLNSWIKGLLNK